MPGYEGISIYVADQKTGEIYGATDATKNGVTFTISSDNESNLAVILLLAVYLALASAVILFMLSKVFKAIGRKMSSSLFWLPCRRFITGCIWWILRRIRSLPIPAVKR